MSVYQKGMFFVVAFFFDLVLVGGFKYVLFSHLLGEDVQFDYIICFNGLKPPTSSCKWSVW